MTAIGRSAILFGTVLFIARTSGAQEISFSAAAGEVIPPFLITSNGISQPELTGVTNAGRAVYTFTVSTLATYVIQAEVNAPNEQANSFFVSVDAEPKDPEDIWDIPVTNGFAVQVVTSRGSGATGQAEQKKFQLASGIHKLIVLGRAPGAELRKVSVLRFPEPPPNLRVFGGVGAGVPAPPRNLRIVPGP